MKIIGYYTSDVAPERHFLDELVKFTDFNNLNGDFAVDVTHTDLLIDPKSYLKINNLIGAYYGDYLDQYGNLCIHGMFPSVRTTYPGVFYNISVASSIRANDIFAEIAKNYIISYIPKTVVKVIL